MNREMFLEPVGAALPTPLSFKRNTDPTFGKEEQIIAQDEDEHG